jgi:hypothetical protein
MEVLHGCRELLHHHHFIFTPAQRIPHCGLGMIPPWFTTVADADAEADVAADPLPPPPLEAVTEEDADPLPNLWWHLDP